MKSVKRTVEDYQQNQNRLAELKVSLTKLGPNLADAFTLGESSTEAGKVLLRDAISKAERELTNVGDVWTFTADEVANLFISRGYAVPSDVVNYCSRALRDQIKASGAMEVENHGTNQAGAVDQPF